jgi:DNA (cytosine-5)-methyltransferase 1
MNSQNAEKLDFQSIGSPEPEGDRQLRADDFVTPSVEVLGKVDSLAAFQDWLARPTPLKVSSPDVVISDLFCGPGGFSYGFKAGLADHGLFGASQLAVDYEQNALRTYATNHAPSSIRKLDLTNSFNLELGVAKERIIEGSPVMVTDVMLRTALKASDVLLCSPPCTGFSNLNNVSRGVDPKNALLVAGLGLGIVSHIDTIFMENVPQIHHDKSRILDAGLEMLSAAGYAVEIVILKGERIGLPQTRSRLVLIASKTKNVQKMKDFLESVDIPPVAADLALDFNNPLAWDDSEKPFMDEIRSYSAENISRINYLHDHGLYELPNKERPDCHKDGHSYFSVYGRIYPGKPTGTVTTGYLSPGRGRFIHPTKRRGLTVRDGARLQSFPDHYIFDCKAQPSVAARLIGDAVPPLMSYWIGTAYARCR